MVNQPYTIDAGADLAKLIPLEDHMLVKVFDREKTSGGILLPKNEATPCRVGKIIAKGKEITNSYNGKGFPIEVEPGDYIMFMDYAGIKVKADREDYKLLREHGIWAKVELSVSGDIIDFETIKPWADRVVLERIDETMTKSKLLHLPPSEMKFQWNIGTVKWSGRGMWHLESGRLIPNECQPGDRVIFRRFTGADIMVRGKEYRITQELDIIAAIAGSGDGERLRPMRNRVVIEREQALGKSAGGIVIPGAHQQKQTRGTVRALGPGKLAMDGSDRPWELALGDKVLFVEKELTDVVHNGRQYVVAESENILGVMLD